MEIAEHQVEEGRDAAELKERLAEVESENARLQSRLAKDQPLKPYQVELLKLQRHLEAKRIPMVVLFEGRDASGKGGTIRRVTRYMNEKRFRVVAMGKPTDSQKTQWYFQRYVAQFPAGGDMVLFDRSWYNRALVEPVFGFCTKDQYRAFMKGVVGFYPLSPPRLPEDESVCITPQRAVQTDEGVGARGAGRGQRRD